jgi:asparagine synthase (glutamine-hydrolysing)
LEVNESDCLNWVKEAVINLDMPSVDAINTYIVSKSVRQTGLKVALSGLGGDELFGGYPSFKHVPYLKLLNAFPKNVSNLVVNCLPASFKEKLAGINSFSTTDLTLARRRFYSVSKLKAMGMHNGTPTIPAFPNGFDTMGKISWAEIQGYMLPMLLSDSDQMSMAVGLEIRVPFLDHMKF